MQPQINLSQQEVFLKYNETIISKTDLAGKITYANRAFMQIADYSESKIVGETHTVLRHPDMPRGVFKLLWDTLIQEREFFGYVKSRTANGGFFWVMTNITPDRDANGKVVGYFCVRRAPKKDAVASIQHLYKEMLSVETSAGIANAPFASVDFLRSKLKSPETTYDKFVLSL
jgi:aerotaxis receptor